MSYLNTYKCVSFEWVFFSSVLKLRMKILERCVFWGGFSLLIKLLSSALTDLAIYDDRAIRWSRHLVRCKTLWSHSIGHISSWTSSTRYYYWNLKTVRRTETEMLVCWTGVHVASCLNNDFHLKTIFSCLHVCWNQYKGMFPLSNLCFPSYYIFFFYHR